MLLEHAMPETFAPTASQQTARVRKEDSFSHLMLASALKLKLALYAAHDSGVACSAPFLAVEWPEEKTRTLSLWRVCPAEVSGSFF